jgi:hypothetical protein
MGAFELDSKQSGGTFLIQANEGQPSIRLSEIISELSYALDLTEGQPMGHSVRSCVIGMRLGKQIGLSLDDQAEPLLRSPAQGRRMQQQRLALVSHFERG